MKKEAKKRVAVNTRFLLKNKLEGIGIYTQEIFRRVVKLLPEYEFYFLFDRKPDAEFIFDENVKELIVSPQARHPLLWYWWFERSVPKVLKELNADLFISPDGYGSLNTQVPQIITIHDLAFEHYETHTPFLVRNYYKYFVPKYCAKAEKILAVSNFTKQDIIERYKIDEEKIDVVYNAVDLDEMSMVNSQWSMAEKLWSLKKPYFLFIGAVHPRKNVLGLLKAFENFKTDYSHSHQLVIIGRKAWMNNELENFYSSMKFKNDIVWIEKIERSMLLEILKNSFALVYPSFFEGFGIPVIEAMSLGVPVISSNTSSMPEISAGAAITVDPHNITSISQAMNELIANENLRNDLIEKGLRRAKDFTWDISAKKVADLIRDAVV
ncbi:MAG: hypothetical protein JWN78_1349 [Bacteroidota bacterium]|nr:hypothetical protein [Bacteroidota bacterium]